MKTNSISAGLAVHGRTIATTRHLIFRRACLWTGFLAFATIAFGPPPAQAAVTEAWVQRYGSEAGSQDNAYKVVTEVAGNVIVAGSTGYQTGGGADMLIIKYSGAGVPQWTNRYKQPKQSNHPGACFGHPTLRGARQDERAASHRARVNCLFNLKSETRNTNENRNSKTEKVKP